MGDLKRLHSVVQTIAVSLSWAVSTLYVFAGGSVALFTLLLFCSRLFPTPRASPAGQAPVQRGWQRPALSALGPGMPPAGSALISPVGR